MDIVSEVQRSYNMSRIRSKDTKPELMVRSMLHRMGYRFTVNGPKNRQLPGKPDIVLPRYKTVIFVHGCFWHAHEKCKHFRLPKTRTEWWKAKLEGNAKRDTRNEKELKALGWQVVVVWTCELRTCEKIYECEVKILKSLSFVIHDQD
jgi:DNA mismatch endonuclease (patch repair protein)